MNFLGQVESVIAAPARWFSDYAHRRKRGADLQIAYEISILGHVAIVVSSLILGQIFFAIIAALVFMAVTFVGSDRPEMQKFQLPETDLRRFMRIVISLIGVAIFIKATVEDNYLIAILATGFLINVFGEQIMAHRRKTL